jgi:8-oxo-dGTP pyrophosphatase MutT (NUDIX family)
MNSRNIKKAGVILTDTANRFLLVLGRIAQKWSFPKGTMEENEVWLTCAKREAFEETGLILNIPENSDTYISGKTVYFFIGPESVTNGWKLSPKDRREIVKAKWFTKKELYELPDDTINYGIRSYKKKYPL